MITTRGLWGLAAVLLGHSPPHAHGIASYCAILNEDYGGSCTDITTGTGTNIAIGFRLTDVGCLKYSGMSFDSNNIAVGDVQPQNVRVPRALPPSSLGLFGKLGLPRQGLL